MLIKNVSLLQSFARGYVRHFPSPSTVPAFSYMQLVHGNNKGNNKPCNLVWLHLASEGWSFFQT